jgi:hypothetical protein
MNAATLSLLKHMQTDECNMWEINFIVVYKRFLHAAQPVCSGWCSFSQETPIIFFASRKFIMFTKACQRARS